ncbi:MAG: phospholipid carrier-dependent glycosyltransferase [Deltaproteobacteria bacterium]|nr:phospholipid carrier-dependent glycosyltransferase [Deltaproteobacteria bacterium]
MKPEFCLRIRCVTKKLSDFFMNQPRIPQKINLSFFLLMGVTGFLFFFRLGVPGLMDPDEGRYAEIAREMLVLGDFVTPHLNFLPYLEKPPLVYWLTAFSLALGGLNEWAARFIPALSAMGGVLAVYWLVNKLAGPWAAFLAGMVTATSSGYFILGRLLILDMTLTCFLTWGIGLTYLAVRNQERRYLPWAYLTLALAVLAKGPVAVVLPGLIFSTWFLIRRDFWGFFRLWHPGGVLIFAVVVFPWYILVALTNPDFWHYFFWQEHLERFLTPRIHAGQPFYFYAGVLVASFLPWIFLLPWAWGRLGSERSSVQTRQDRLFLILWFGVVFVFFSLARAKLFPYLLPALPPVAILVGWALATQEMQGSRDDSPVWAWSLRVWCSLALLLVMGLVISAVFFPLLWDRLAFLAPYPLAYMTALAGLPLLLSARLLSPVNQGRLLLAGAVGLNLLLLLGIERVAEVRSPRSMAQAIQARWSDDSALVGFHLYSQGISFYARQPFHLFRIRGELDFGLSQRPDNPYYFTREEQLRELLRQHPHFFVLVDKKKLKIFQEISKDPITILTQWKNQLLITNR